MPTEFALPTSMPPARHRCLSRALLPLLCGLLLAGCDDTNSKVPASPVVVAPAADREPAPDVVLAARRQIGVTVRYDPAYTPIAYPNGDVLIDRGVCTDVVIRAMRTQGLDLQKQVHEDIRANFAAYPRHWGLRGPDRNIDHRRVPNLQRWFERQGWNLDASQQASTYRAGDLVTWTVSGKLPHIGIVSNRRSLSGTPLIIHNIGRGTQEEDVLFAWPITGHYRPVLATAGQPRQATRH